jgi:multidrug efflux pump subunit AcrB
MLVILLLGCGKTPRPSQQKNTLRIVTVYPIHNAEMVEKLITNPIEKSLQTLTELETMSSTSGADTSVIMVKFKPGVDIYTKTPQVKDCLKRVEELLPQDIPGLPTLYIESNSP